MNFYLIQRGTFKDIKDLNDITGIDSIITWDYMGSAEFEFGSLPKSLHTIVDAFKKRPTLFLKKDIEKFFTTITIKETPFTLFHITPYSKTEIKEIENLFTLWSDIDSWKDAPRLKEVLGIHHYFEGKTISSLKRGCKKKRIETKNYSYMNFFWDIDNHFFVFPSAPIYKEYIIEALEALSKRW